MTAVIFFIIFTASFIAVFPVVFRWADRRLCHPRLLLHTFPHSTTAAIKRNTTRQTTSHRRVLPSDFADADACEYLASAIRAGVAPRDALIMLCDTPSVSPDVSRSLLAHLSAHEPLTTTLTRLHQNWPSSQSLFVDCLFSSQVDGIFFPNALEYSAQLLRNRAQEKLSARSHTAHARATSRILTGLPIASILIAVTISDSMRTVVFSKGGVVLLVLGLLLNTTGWWWMRALMFQVSHQDHVSDLERLTRSFCVSMMAGLSVTRACEQWSNISVCGQDIAAAIRRGELLAEALIPLAHVFGPEGETLARSVLEAHSSGTPVHDMTARFSADLRRATTSQREEHARQLPAKLSMPVVFCVLPAFLFVVLIPIALASLRSLPLT